MADQPTRTFTTEEAIEKAAPHFLPSPTTCKTCGLYWPFHTETCRRRLKEIG